MVGVDTDLLNDLEIGARNMLTLGEDMLVSCIVHKSHFDYLRFVEIPVEKRNLECPIRITVEIDHSKLKPPAP